ncbi:MAG: hypothetical protein ACTS6J_14185 [Burkholderiales bacterium]
MNKLGLWLGRRIGDYLSRTTHADSTSLATEPGRLAAALRPGDVLLGEGNTRLSVAIKYLTQSTWSHAALYIGQALGPTNAEGESLCFVEADITDGVRAVPLSGYHGLHTRICRPVNLSPQDLEKLLDYACARMSKRNALVFSIREVMGLSSEEICNKSRLQRLISMQYYSGRG